MSSYQPVMIGRTRIRRLNGYCDKCQCLTSELKTFEDEVSCWNCGNTDLDWTYQARVYVHTTLHPGGLLSEILTGDKIRPVPTDEDDPDDGETQTQLTMIESDQLPPEYAWLRSLMM